MSLSRRSPVLACPHCTGVLDLVPTGARCPAGHSFDRARDGHLNLLVGGRLGPSTVAGDTADALAARRRFLSSGAYEPIALALSAAVGDTAGPVLDIGCGEGYYLGHIAAEQRFGLDISKRAVQMASKLLPDAQFVVGSAYRLPILDVSVEVVMSVFAPHPLDEMVRVLRPHGRWVTVTPGPMHLHEMRPERHGDAARKALERQRRRADPPDGATAARRLEAQIALTPETARDLFFMTPLQWQADAGAVEPQRIATVTVDVWIATGSPIR